MAQDNNTKKYLEQKIKDVRAKLRSPLISPIEVQAQARQTGKECVNTLREILKNPMASDVVRISAAQTLLDRGYGRPTQTNINASVDTDGSPAQITDKELDRRIDETLRATEALTRAAGPQKRKREKIQSEAGPADVRKLH